MPAATPVHRYDGDAPAASERRSHDRADADLLPGRVEHLVPVAGARHPGGDHLSGRRAPRSSVEEVLPGVEPARVAGAPDPVGDVAPSERHMAEVVPADHVPRVSHGRAPQAPACTQGPQTVCPPVPVLDAQNRSREALDAHVRLVRLVTSPRRAHDVVRAGRRRKAHEERERDQNGDEKAAQNAACAISSKHERHRQVGGLARARPLVVRGWPGGQPIKLEVGPEGAGCAAARRIFRKVAVRERARAAVLVVAQSAASIRSWRSAHQS